MIIYISGPISNSKGCETYFGGAEKYLRERGDDPINPCKIKAPKKSNDEWNYYMREAVKLLATAEKIYMLDGWEDSKGARIEHRLAGELNIPIVYAKDSYYYAQ